MAWTKETLRSHFKSNNSDPLSIKNNEAVWRKRAIDKPNTADGAEAVICAELCREYLAEVHGDFELLNMYGSGGGDTATLINALCAPTTPVYIKA